MAVTESRNTRTLIAGEDLSAHQFKFVKLNGANADAADTAGEQCFGLVENDPTAGQEATVVVSGKTRVVASAAIAAGAAVSTAADGRARTAVATDIIMGYALEAAGSAGQVIAMELIQGGNAA